MKFQYLGISGKTKIIGGKYKEKLSVHREFHMEKGID